MDSKIILHNSVSIDGSLTGFQPNMGLHYRIAGEYKPDAHLIGSNTAKIGVELYGNGIPPEEDNDFTRIDRGDDFPYWVIIDTKGKMEGKLHMLRSFEYCRDVILFVSEATSIDFLGYLEERDYRYHILGEDSVDIQEAISLLEVCYGVDTILTDTGRILGNILLNKGLVSEISLLIHPTITGNGSYRIFDNIQRRLNLRLINNEIIDYDYSWSRYEVIR